MDDGDPFTAIASWPTSWAGVDADLGPGHEIAAYMLKFMRHIERAGLTQRTLRHHLNNLWLVGGEMIRDLHDTPELRRKDVRKLLLGATDGGARVVLHLNEVEQRRLDATARRFHRFLSVCSPDA